MAMELKRNIKTYKVSLQFAYLNKDNVCLKQDLLCVKYTCKTN